MPGKVRLPAPEVVSALLDVGHTFPPERWGFSWAMAGDRGRGTIYVRLVLYVESQGFRD